VRAATPEILEKAEMLGCEVIYKKVPGFFGVGKRQVGPFLLPPLDNDFPKPTRMKHAKAFVDRLLGEQDYLGGGMPRAVLALDFDGVLIDSVPESAEAAWRTVEKIWPEVLTKDVRKRKKELMDAMRTVRPVVETGYENPVLLRCLIDGASVQEVLHTWGEMLPKALDRYSTDKDTLMIKFGRTRDEWIEKKNRDWVQTNGIYPEVRYFMRKALDRHDVYIVTTKQKRFVERLLEKRLFFKFDSNKIFDTSRGTPKAEILKMLQSKHPNASRYVFIEDKLSTLEKVKKESSLNDWKLYLAKWGYNTEKEQVKAEVDERIETLDYIECNDVFGENHLDTKFPKPCFVEPPHASELHPESMSRLLSLPSAIARYEVGIATPEDVMLIKTTPPRYTGQEKAPKWRDFLMLHKRWFDMV